MNAIQKEADEIIHWMRQSKMNAIREELEKIMKGRDIGSMNANARFIERLKELFKATSNNAPLP